MNSKTLKMVSVITAVFIMICNVTIVHSEDTKVDKNIIKMLPKGMKVLKVYEKDINSDGKNEVIVTFYASTPKESDGFMVFKRCKVNNKSTKFVKIGQTVKYNYKNIKVYFGDMFGTKNLEILTLNSDDVDGENYVDVYYISKNFMQKTKCKDKLSCDSLKLVNLTDNQGVKDNKVDIVIYNKNEDTGDNETHIYKIDTKGFTNCDSKFPPYTDNSNK